MNSLSFAIGAGVLLAWVWLIQREGGIGLGVRFMWVFSFASQFFFGPLLYYFVGLPPSEDDPIGRDAAVRAAAIGFGAFLVGAYRLVPYWAKRKYRRWTTTMIQAEAASDKSVWQMGPNRRKQYFAELEAKRTWGEFGSEANQEFRRKAAIALITLGFVSQLGSPVFYRIATVRAVWSNITLLVEVGATMYFIFGYISKDRHSMMIAVGVILGSGLVRAATSGFFGSTLQALVFLFAIYLFRERIQWRNWLMFIAVGVLSFIPYYAWLSARGALRESIARGATFTEKREVFLNELKFPSIHEIFAPSGVEKIQMRIDMSGLLAHGIEYTPAYEPFAGGKTIFPNVFIALVPRDLYESIAQREKPKVGDTTIVSQYTGLVFAEGTSVGLPVIFEFYVNYGYWGIAAGCLFMGLLCGYLDQIYRYRGAQAHWTEYTGLLLLWPMSVTNTSLYQMSMTLPVCVLLCVLLHKFILPAMITKKGRFVPLRR